MKIAWITGGKGFIGRNLAEFVATLDYKPYGIGHGFWAPEDYQKWAYQNWLNAEIDFSNLNHLATNSGMPDVIFHLAGGSAVGPSIQNPYEDFQRTVDTTARLLEWVRQVSPSTKVIGISSAAVYGADFLGPIRESAKGLPFSPYGFHKAMLESLFDSYRETYGLKLVVARLFSVYGPWLEKQLLWDICQKLRMSNDGEIVLQGTGKELRDWTDVREVARALVLLAESDNKSVFKFNIGTGTGTSVNEIAKMLTEAWCGEKIPHKDITFTGISRKGDPFSLVAEPSKLMSMGFVWNKTLKQGIEEYVAWFKQYKF